MKDTVKIGLFFLISVAIIIVGIMAVGQFRLFRSGYTLYVDFNFIGDLREGAKVQYRGGLPIGTVERIYINEEQKIRVEALIKNDMKLYEGTRFSIYTVGMGLGEKYLLVTPPPTQEGSYIPEGAILKGVDSISLEGTMFSMTDLAKEFGDEFTTDDVSGTLRNLINLSLALNVFLADTQKNLQTVTRDVTGVSQDLHGVANLLEDNLRGTRDILVTNKGEISETISNVATASAGLSSTLASIDSAAAVLQQQLRGLDTVGKGLSNVIVGITNGDGTVGKLLTDDSLYTNANNVMTSVDSAAQEVEKLSEQLTRLAANIDDQTLNNTITNIEHALANLGETFTEISETFSNVNTILLRFEQSDETLLEMAIDEETYDDVKVIIKNLKSFSEKIEKKPSLLIDMSPFER